jgi:hypothetical protein
LNVLYHGIEVYHYVNAGASIDDVKKTIRAAETSANLVGVITSLEINSNVLSSKELDGSTIQSTVDKLEYIIVGAFDGECYLIWTPHSF